MARERSGLLNQLDSKLPEGLLVDAAWLKAQGYSTQLQHQYVKSGWLQQPTRSVFRRPPRGPLTWQQVVISLQTILNYSPLIVGGRTALELQGYAHYLPQTTKEIHLYGPRQPPNWLDALKLETRFAYHNDRKLFRKKVVTRSRRSLS